MKSNRRKRNFIIGIDEVGRAASKRRASPYSYVIGIDEVGRGALAGPVTVAAACIPSNMPIVNQGWGNLKDSKKLSPAQRKKWFAYFSGHPAIHYKVARVYPRGIERLNISKAANRAASHACGRLMGICKLLGKGRKAGNCKIFLDGGLFFEYQNKLPRAKTVIKADEKIAAVAIASIIAKVSRDGYMERLSKKYPRYGFEIHKGYGTKKHFAAIKKYGPNRTHRLTFIRFSQKIRATSE